MINIVIPMAGHGSRFSKAGYKEPKPLIPIKGKPMIELVIENLKPSKEHCFIFVCQSEHLRDYYLRDLLEKKSPGCKIIEVTQVTEGAACSVLLAKEFINNQDQLMIANCDQYIDVDINKYLAILDEYIIDGLIMTMKAYDDKWSFIKLNDKNEISLIVEKEIVSDEATVGIYNYQRGSDFVKSAEKMIAKNFKVNREFYVAPTYNEMIMDRMNIKYFNIGRLGFGMHGLGTPEDLNNFLKS
jgi:NDP-sugar pyrophosphorylase family protein